MMLGSKKRQKEQEEQEQQEQQDASTATRAVDRAREHLYAMTGKSCESVVGFQRTEEGWRVRAVVVEVRRIPPTTDILACYELEINEDGELESCGRVSRYWRSQPMNEADGGGNSS